MKPSLSRLINGFGYYSTEPTPRREQPKLPAGHRRLARPAYEYCHYYHYSNPESQNALIVETKGFPNSFNPATHEVSEAYSDRMRQWDSKHYSAILAMVGTGEQGWPSALKGRADSWLCEFAQFALKLPVLPDHVQVVHWYNVSNGYSCPTVLAVYRK